MIDNWKLLQHLKAKQSCTAACNISSWLTDRREMIPWVALYQFQSSTLYEWILTCNIGHNQCDTPMCTTPHHLGYCHLHPFCSGLVESRVYSILYKDKQPGWIDPSLENYHSDKLHISFNDTCCLFRTQMMMVEVPFLPHPIMTVLET